MSVIKVERTRKLVFNLVLKLSKNTELVTGVVTISTVDELALDWTSFLALIFKIEQKQVKYKNKVLGINN
jgi:hypothetical protein